MIDFSSTVVELSGDSEKQKEVQDIAKCLRTLYSTPIGSQEGDRELGINPNIFVDKPLPVAKGLYVAEVTETSRTSTLKVKKRWKKLWPTARRYLASTTKSFSTVRCRWSGALKRGLSF